jgi:hypothetical protein
MAEHPNPPQPDEPNPPAPPHPDPPAPTALTESDPPRCKGLALA